MRVDGEPKVSVAAGHDPVLGTHVCAPTFYDFFRKLRTAIVAVVGAYLRVLLTLGLSVVLLGRVSKRECT